MDFITADVTAIDGVELGDEVVIIGEQEGEHIGADEVAESVDSITWEILARIGPRVTRIPVERRI
jgi:alanine racemase